MTTAVLAAVAAGSVWLVGLGKKPSESAQEPVFIMYGTLVDNRDGKTYKTVNIGNKTWMAENLDYQADGSWYYRDGGYYKQYGRLYDWNVAMTVCPEGWHLPSRKEWNNLCQTAGGKKEESNFTGWKDAGKKLKAKSGWMDTRGKSGNGTDDYGFSALPGGKYYGEGVRRYGFIDAGFYGTWWTTAEYDAADAHNRSMSYWNGDVSENRDSKSNGFSVRCVQDVTISQNKPKWETVPVTTDTSLETHDTLSVTTYALRVIFDTLTDTRDGKTYKTVNMPDGNIWMAENLDYKPKTGKSWCYGDSDSYCKKYGRLYDWKTAKSVCPKGWHLPSRAEWDDLAEAVGGRKDESNWSSRGHDWHDAGKYLKSKTGWTVSSWIKGLDTYGFSALPGGYRYSDSNFRSAGDNGYWWTAVENGSSSAYRRNMYYNDDYINEYDDDENYGCSVRCIEDVRRFGEY
jgi:uncharacterized protein (TIGR02145 family)